MKPEENSNDKNKEESYERVPTSSTNEDDGDQEEEPANKKWIINVELSRKICEPIHLNDSEWSIEIVVN